MSAQQVHDVAVELWNRFPGRVLLNEPLRHHTTYQVGGPAVALCLPGDRPELQEILQFCHRQEVAVFILGGGSNLLVHDKGLESIVIKLDACCSELHHKHRLLYAGAGVLLSRLVAYCEAHDLGGLEFMSGIPGTVGGALRMNAGAFVGEIGDRVVQVDAITYPGDLVVIPGEEAGFGYRRADHLQDKIMLGCSLKMEAGIRSELERSRENYLAQRASRQPLDYGSCGSVFKRPPGNYAGALIEKVGGKGMQIGGAMVSPKHANFIINYKDATAGDIFQLIQKIQKLVYDHFKIWLELEVKLVGFTDEDEEKVARPR